MQSTVANLLFMLNYQRVICKFVPKYHRTQTLMITTLPSMSLREHYWAATHQKLFLKIRYPNMDRRCDLVPLVQSRPHTH